MPLVLILLLLLAGSISFYASDTPNFSFGAAPGVFYRSGTDLIVGFNLRKAGEPAGVSYFAFPDTSQWRPLIEKLISTDDFQWTYYSIETAGEPPKARIMPIVNPISQQALKDISENSENQRKAGWDTVQAAPDTLILSIKPISQNEFLNVNPRIVPDPTKSK
jgi:hypothetical protein